MSQSVPTHADDIIPMSQKLTQTLVPICLLILLGLIWGGVPNLSKYVGQAGMAPQVYAFYTVALGAIVLLVTNLIRRQTFPLSGKHLRFYLLSGIISTGIPVSVMFAAVNHIPAGLMAMLMAFIPMLAYTISLLVFNEQFNVVRLVGIGVGFAGAMLILMTQSSSMEGVSLLWVAIGFITPLFYAIGNIYNHRYRPENLDSLVAANGMLISAALFLLVVIAIVGQFDWVLTYNTDVIAVTALHGVLTAVAFAVFFGLLKIAGPIVVSQVAYLVTLFGIGIGMLLFAERFNSWFWLALGLIFVGLLLVNRAPSKT